MHRQYKNNRVKAVKEPQLRTPAQRRRSSPPPIRPPAHAWQFTKPREVFGPGQGWYVWGFVRFQICARGHNPAEAQYHCHHLALTIEDRNPTLFKANNKEPP